jgi:hypothetical protein
MIYKGYKIIAHVEALNLYELDDDGFINAFNGTDDQGNVKFYSASDDIRVFTCESLAELKSAIDATITPPPPAHAHGNTYYRSLYLREADKVATLQKAVDQFANRVIIAETEVTMLRDQLAQYRGGHDL